MAMNRNFKGLGDIPLEREDVKDIGRVGACPECGQYDRVLPANGEYWAVCDVHRVRWMYEDGPCGGTGFLSPVVEARTTEVLAGYRELPEHQACDAVATYEVRWALDLVLAFLWEHESHSYAQSTSMERERHIFRCLHILDCWLKGQEPWVTLDPFAFGFHWFHSKGRTMTATNEVVGRDDEVSLTEVGRDDA